MDAAPTTLPELTRVLRTAEGIEAVVASLRARGAGTIDGTWGSSAGLSAATLANEAPSTLLVVIAHPGDVEGWSNDLASFCKQRPVVFPAFESWPADQSKFDDTPRKRLRLVQQLASNPPPVLLTTFAALMQPVPEKSALESRGRRLKKGEMLDLDEFGQWLVANGYKRTDAVEMPGEFSRRGGILDVFSTDAEDPVRLEFFGDEIDSIRPFSSGTQRSLGELVEMSVLGSERKEANSAMDRGHLTEHLPKDAWVVFVEFGDLKEQGKFFLESVDRVEGLFTGEGVIKMLTQFPSVMLSAMPRPGLDAVAHLRVESVERFSGNVNRVREELDQIAREDRVLIACHNEAEINRLSDVLKAGALAQSDRLRLVTGSIRAGFRLVEHGIVVIGSHELFHREQTAAGQKNAEALPKRRIESRAIDSFLELRDGDLVVHVVHGIARFRGMQLIPRRGGDESPKSNAPQSMEECLILEFREGTKMYVPVSKIDLVQKYVGGSKADPELSKLGGTAWAKKVSKVEEAVADMASDMLQLQAVREAQTGFAYQTDTDWQKEFEAAFPFQETPDQLTAIEEIKQDMQRARPMDRLLCGDVGYGKTEVAIRGVFKAIDSGKQVAVLVPTTVLAEQHYRTFTSRLAEYPFTVEALSRFRTAKEQTKVLKGLKAGSVDVVIGTHRLVSPDVTFKDLGLVIIDEEQRFGVHHKERLKQLRSMVDVLTMTATPIPRTLHLSLLGIREISNLETPPPERLPVETRIVRWDDKLIRAAILRELNRDGQVYFVHNRVMDIHAVALKIKTIVPEADIVIGHGQMKEGELEESMLKFVRKEAHILVATTIIESGLDIPNANTIFINEADHYGLAELHQLRGRVGRQKNRAYAYLLLDAERGVSGTAALRLKAIEEFNELGAGFKIAMRDLEIRGAGNILGMEQSGHIASVGYELYCSLLENAVRQMKHMPLRTPLEVNVDLPWPAFLPREYVPGQKLRMEVYRRLSRVREPRKLDDFRQELRDRYGPVPESAEWLLRLAEVKLLAARWQIGSVHLNGPNIVLGYRNAKKAHQLADRSEGRLKVVDEKDIYGRWQEGEDTPEAMYALLKHLLRGAKEE
ncbi:transcription-repair coupling factor [Zavarzinella formosa]|uniref:transcription-repair coupling factor n=1 Tax=Zavarzinella formosa TaxID=360055 RepID=UPI0002D28CB1|nr:transcription-repair coupling factor [Zavarzinella formosa]